MSMYNAAVYIFRLHRFKFNIIKCKKYIKQTMQSAMHKTHTMAQNESDKQENNASNVVVNASRNY